MNYQNPTTIIDNLRKQLRLEEERYRTALRGNYVFWELKEIYQRIKELKLQITKSLQQSAWSLSETMPKHDHRFIH